MRERPELGIVRTTRTERVRVERLDEWMLRDGEARVDVLKLDVQGAELQVIEGAGTALDQVRLIEVEVAFTPMYLGQPLFGEVDAALRERGFALWRLGHLVHYGRDGACDLPGPALDAFYDGHHEAAPGRGGQLYWAHAHFVAADIAFREPGSWRQKTRDAAICACAGFEELARWALADALADHPPAQAAAAIAAAGGRAR